MQAIIDSATREVLAVGTFTADPPEGQELVTLTAIQETRMEERGIKTLAANGVVVVTLPQYAIDEDTRVAQERAARAAAVAIIKPLALSSVGKALTALTANEQRAMLAILLWQAGALDGAGTIRPLGQWVKE